MPTAYDVLCTLLALYQAMGGEKAAWYLLHVQVLHKDLAKAGAPNRTVYLSLHYTSVNYSVLHVIHTN